jgi:hypothetical protein
MNRNPRRALTLLTVFGILASIVLAEQAPEIPSGTTVKIRMIDRLSSEETQIGDTFAATLEEPISVNGKDLYPKGANVSGRVVDVHKSGRLSEPGELDLVLTTVSTGHSAVSISVEPLVMKGESHAKSNAGKIGGGAALGAIIGAIAGGGKGAAIGAGVGGAAGTGAAAATGKRAAIVDSEAVLSFTTSSGSNSSSVNPPPRNSPSPTPDTAKDEQNNDSPKTEDAVDQAPTTQDDDTASLFTLRDRRVIRDCVSEHTSDFPPGLTERPDLPAGSERQLRRGETLSSDLRGSVKSLPLACENQLPKLPADQDRVLYNGRVLLVDSSYHILDMFYLDGDD